MALPIAINETTLSQNVFPYPESSGYNRLQISYVIAYFQESFLSGVKTEVRGADIAKNLLKRLSGSLAEELAITQRSDKLTHIERGAAAMNKIGWMLMAIIANDKTFVDKQMVAEPEKLESLKFSPEETSQLESDCRDNPDLPIANRILQTELFCRGLYNQWKMGITEETSKKFVYNLYKRINHRYGSYDKVADTVIDRDGVRHQITNALKEQRKLGNIPENPRILLLGPDTGKKVEGPMIDSLLADGTFTTCDVTGVDLGSTKNTWSGMRVVHMDFVEYAKQVGSHDYEPPDVIIAAGSVWNNDESQYTWLDYMTALAKISKLGTIFMYDVGDIDTNPTANYRTSMALQMNSLRPDRMIGEYGLIGAYREPSDRPEDYGATLFSRDTYHWLWNLAGYGNWLSDQSWQSGGEDDFRMLLVARHKEVSKDIEQLRDSLRTIAGLFALPQ